MALSGICYRNTPIGVEYLMALSGICYSYVDEGRKKKKRNML